MDEYTDLLTSIKWASNSVDKATALLVAPKNRPLTQKWFYGDDFEDSCKSWVKAQLHESLASTLGKVEVQRVSFKKIAEIVGP